jgi:hypothetical protein
MLRPKYKAEAAHTSVQHVCSAKIRKVAIMSEEEAQN